MRRCARTILVCFLLGAMTTVVVAWGICRYAYRATWTSVSDEYFGATHEQESTQACPDELQPMEPEWPVVGQQTKDGENRSLYVTNREFTLFRDQYGWPLLALETRVWQRCDYLGSSPRGPFAQFVYPITVEKQVGIRAPWALSGDYEFGPGSMLPIWPLLGGFAANTLLYSGLWIIALMGKPAIERWNRRRRNQCLTCGYSLVGNTTGLCPECGTATIAQLHTGR